jgi:hypothetical protein
VHKITGRYSFRIAAAGIIVAGTATGGIVALGAPAEAAVTVPCSAASLISAISTANTTPADAALSLTSGCVYSFSAADNSTDGGNALPVITGSVSITGNGATITRSGSTAFRLFDVASGGSLSLGGMTISNGLADDGINGGGAIFSRGPLTVTGTTFSGNSSPAATGTSGGAINSSGPLSVSLSTFAGNTAQEGGGIFNQSTTATATVTGTTFSGNTATIFGGGGIVSVQGTTDVIRDTFSGNQATGTAGGGAIDNDATLNIDNSTFTGNTGGTNGGGAIQNFGTANIAWTTLSGNSSAFGANLHNGVSTAAMNVRESIVANGGGGGSNCSGTPAVVDGGYNIDTGTSCGFSTANHSLSNTNPQLGPLASNGGPTQTMALPSGSPAVNAIPVTVAGCSGSTDQRGVSRPQGPACDIGAYELVMSSGIIGPGPVSAFANFSKSCLDNSGFRWQAFNKIQLWTCGASGGVDQQLELVPVSGASGTYLLRFVPPSGTPGGPWCVTQSNASASGPIVLGVCNTGTAGARYQFLKLISGAGNCHCGVYYKFTGTGLVIDDWGFNTANGATVGTFAFSGGRNQAWGLP